MLSDLNHVSGLHVAGVMKDMRMELTTFNGLDVFTDQGIYVGRVNDITIDVNERKVSGLAVGNINRDMFGEELGGKGVVIPYRWVTSVGDIVLIKQIPFKKSKKSEEAE